MTTKRYPFRYAEYLAQQRWAGLFFDQKDTDPLKDDIINRQTGQAYQTGFKTPLLKLGILSKQTNTRETDTMIFADDYGADAVRLSLFLEKGKITDTKLTAHWRFIQKAALLFDGVAFNLPKQKDLELPLFYPIIKAWQENDLKKALIATKHAINAEGDPVALLFFLYPFCPHIATYFYPTVHKKTTDFYVRVQKITVPPVYFVEINGKNCDSFYTLHTEEQKIIKEALSLPQLQNKIKGRKIKNVIFIEGKGLNFVV